MAASDLHVFDVTAPTSPRLLTTLPIRPLELELKDGLAYAATAFGAVTILDMRNPAQPVTLGQIARQGGGPNGVVAQGTRLYSALHANPTGLAVHDIGDPSQSRLVATFDAPYQVTGVAADDKGLIALARGGCGISLLRTCPPCFPDCDASTGPGELDVFDFLCFLNRFEAGYRYACDCDTSTGPGVCDAFDFVCFQNAYAAGCP